MGDLQLGALAPPMTASSSLQSNWNASPGAKASGTKTPLPEVCCWRSQSSRQVRTKAATRRYEPS